ncbi:MAG TPA: hypothetical protein VFO60_05145 [Candidatus Dormibacteraeota bacterium]|nr:hypothetical protein [Candidatus Dormibacteraeota bacterium]
MERGERVPPGGRNLRALVTAIGVVLLGVTAGASGAARVSPGASSNAAVAVPRTFHVLADRRALQVSQPGYQLLVDRDTGIAQVASPSGALYTSLPLTALAGRSVFPRGTRTRVEPTPSGLTVDTVAPTGEVLVHTVVTTTPTSFTVGFTAAAVGAGAAGPVLFFSDGRRALDLASIASGYTPDPGQREVTTTPRLDTSVRTPLAPAPLDVELQASAGWMGIGIVQVPDATTLGVLPGGAVAVDYPLGAMSKAAGNGGTVAFPDFVVTFAPAPLAGLRAYHDALVALGAAPASPASGPAWWHDPIVDTWGEQVGTKRARMSPAFTAAWVRSFADDVRQRYGLAHATIVIDSAWQARVGDPEPDPTRFGGWDGMRRLIADLHAQGFHVLLWWPMWARDIRSIPPRTGDLERAGPGHIVDPGRPDFDATMSAEVTRLLGDDPDGLDADGLKLDWAYAIPSGLSNPAVDSGAAALYHYLGVIHAAAAVAHPGAIVEASAASPQFERVTDSVRLYDAWSEASWDSRAAVVAAADPGALIDGDGFETTPRTAVAHAVASTVYGVPALYYDDHYADGAPVSAATARLIGMVMSISSGKGPGVVTQSGSGWRWTGADGTELSTLAGRADVLRWHAGACGGAGLLAATAPGTLVVGLPLPARAVVTATAGGRTVPVQRQRDGLRLTVAPGEVVTLTATC